MMSGVGRPHCMAAVAGQKLQRTLLARWRHAATAPIHSAAWRLCQVEVSRVGSETGSDFPAFTKKDQGDASPAVLAAAPPSAKKVKTKLVVLRHELTDKLPKSTWGVLRPLKELGYDTYVVGGSVRDLLLKHVPKDYDVLCTASLTEVQKGLRRGTRTHIVGKRFPICIVTSGHTVTEVSSFCTTLRTFGHERPQKFVKPRDLLGVEDWDESDFARWENSQKRDFTVNGLMYDPFKKVVYDYVGGLQDLKKSKIRTVTRAKDSFAEDPGRILRAFRFAARLQFSLARDTAKAVESQKHLITDITEGRLALEVNMLMAYGAAERSVRLLSKHGALEYVFPFQAQYLRARNSQAEGSNLLLDLLANMDRVVTPDRPCHSSLWTLILAFHLAITKRKRSHLTAAAFALAVYHRTGLVVAEKKAKRILKKHKEQEKSYLRESVMNELNVKENPDNSIVGDTEDLVTEVINALLRLSSGKRAYIAKGKAMEVVERARDTLKPGDAGCPTKKRGDFRDDPERVRAATAGDEDEVSYVFSRIVLNTLFPSSGATTVMAGCSVPE